MQLAMRKYLQVAKKAFGLLNKTTRFEFEFELDNGLEPSSTNVRLNFSSFPGHTKAFQFQLAIRLSSHIAEDLCFFNTNFYGARPDIFTSICEARKQLSFAFLFFIFWTNLNFAG